MADIKNSSSPLESITVLCVFSYYITCWKPRAEKKKEEEKALCFLA